MGAFFAILLGLTFSFTAKTQAAGGFFIPDDGYPAYKVGSVECRNGMSAEALCFELSEDFAYISTYNNRELGFQAKAGLITDGASIPQWAQGIIGKPHEKAFSRAAVIHDHYVLKENAVIDYFLTQRVFRDILLDSGVDKARANAMFLAVLAFAPKWSIFYKAEPEDCVGLPANVYCVRADPGEPDDVTNYVEGTFVDEDAMMLLTSIIESVDLETAPDVVIEGLAMRMRVDLGLETPAPVTFGGGG